ncbi:DEAD box ATP dependent RNA helicase [Fasciola gigantica]|uniref:DEAD box ATP dependent RNA helicase n=1 Tax=Fasciola gigantica TaxID=46835 RepID=A0A504YC18_FASGI|nr:DEAD box ATP dependent RNA helicase [Fasciola gigantica]
MADLLDELSAHGFEIVKDESGQVLVKLVFMDENDEATGYALVAPEDAKKILSGEAALQNVVDDEGKQVLTLAPVVSEDQDDLNQVNVSFSLPSSALSAVLYAI